MGAHSFHLTTIDTCHLHHLLIHRDFKLSRRYFFKTVCVSPARTFRPGYKHVVKTDHARAIHHSQVHHYLLRPRVHHIKFTKGKRKRNTKVRRAGALGTMSHDHMSMGSMVDLPALTEFPKFYYAVVGSAVGVATLVNIYNHFLCRQRLSAAREGSQTPSKPNSWLALLNASLYALTREASYFSVRIPLRNRLLRLPTVGRFTLVVANVVVLVVLCTYGLDLNNVFSREDVGFRCGVVTISQLPLIFMLSGKNNIIGFLSGISYERLNWSHRWCARCMLLTATIHMGYFFSGTDLSIDTYTGLR